MFHSGRTIIPEQWRENLKLINHDVSRMHRDQQKRKEIPRIRIAILDTGYNPTMPFFTDKRRSARIKWQDFTQGSKYGVDSYGHGTLMTSLVMEAAPLADIYVTRVAENTDQLGLNADKVAKVRIETVKLKFCC
jgi:hypothetical protein